MKLSILIPSRNMAGKIDQCLDSIYTGQADEADFEVVVCDSSDDGSMEAWKRRCLLKDNLKVMHVAKPLAAGPARNLAWEKCSGEYVMCLDVDDRLASADALKKVMEGLDGKDAYACSYVSRRDRKVFTLKPETPEQLAEMPVACWTKICRRELWVKLPPYMPEDVWTHFALADRCRTVGHFDFPVVDYDNTPENTGAISRTFDWLLANPCNLERLAQTGELEERGLRDEFVAGVIHNLADMWGNRGLIRQPGVKAAYMRRFSREYRNFMAGVYVH